VERWNGVKVRRDRDAKDEKEGRMRVWVGRDEQS
jgi:hypothetical protein